VLKKSLIAVIVLAGLIFLFTYPKVYLMRGSAGGTLYWSSQEAIVIIESSTQGAHMGCARYALEPLLVSLTDVRQPDDWRCSGILVIRVTDGDVESHDTDLYRNAEDPYCGMHTVVFQDQIYMGYFNNQNKIWRWSDTHFVAATEKELRGFDPVKAPSFGYQFDNIDGWSMRTLAQGNPKYQLALNGEPVTISFSGEMWPQEPVSVDVQRPGQPAQRIWEFDGRPHRVSKPDYQHIFEQH
jgi:hypothetical protein